MGELFQQAEAWLDQIEQTQDYTLPYVDTESKTEPVRLNLMMSFWFYDGDQLEVKEKFVKKNTRLYCFDRCRISTRSIRKKPT